MIAMPQRGMLAGMELSLTRRSPDRLSVVIATVIVVAATLIDIEVGQGLPRRHEIRLVADVVVGGSAIAALAGFRPLLMVIVGSAASLTVSLVMAGVHGDPPLLGAAELGGLLALEVVGIRLARSGGQLAFVVASVSVAVVGGGLLRATPGFGVTADLAYLGSSVVVAGGIGWWWRSLHARRERSAKAARQAERLELARELHDVVAHHVTGIVVQLQALRQIADRQPDQVVEALPMLEAAANRSLEAMRHMVWALRATASAPIPTRTADFADDIRQIASATSVPTRIDLTIADQVTIPHTVMLAAERVVREALTNIARHAAPGAQAHITVSVDHRSATVHVTNDGLIGSKAAEFGSGAGLGLTGLAERIALHGGEFSVGPIPGGGWSVRATIPIEDS